MHSRKSSIASLKYGKKQANQTAMSDQKLKNTQNSQKSLIEQSETKIEQNENTKEQK